MTRIWILSAVACCLLCLAACKREDDEYILGNEDGPDIASLIHYEEVSPGSIPADTISTAKITVAVDPQADSAGRYITFHTTSGLFDNNDTILTTQINVYGTATVYLRSYLTGLATIRTTVKGINVDTVIHFVASMPEALLLSADKYVADSTDSFTVSAALFRSPGKGQVTDPARVYFSIVAATPQANNLVMPAFADSQNGNASVVIYNPFNVRGRYQILAKAASGSTDSIRRSIEIVIR